MKLSLLVLGLVSDFPFFGLERESSFLPFFLLHSFLEMDSSPGSPEFMVRKHVQDHLLCSVSLIILNVHIIVLIQPQEKRPITGKTTEDAKFLQLL